MDDLKGYPADYTEGQWARDNGVALARRGNTYQPDVRDYASNLVGASEYALDARAWWVVEQESNERYSEGRALASGHIAAFSAMLDLLLGTRDEAKAREKLERIG